MEALVTFPHILESILDTSNPLCKLLTDWCSEVKSRSKCEVKVVEWRVGDEHVGCLGIIHLSRCQGQDRSGSSEAKVIARS